MKSLFVELQTEELPPKALKKLSEAFAAGVHKSLAAQSMLTETSTVKAYGAPRRMGVLITEVLEKSPDKAFEQRLVPVRVGLDAEGKPTAALTKKMAALGITADVSELKRVNDGKNEQLVYTGVRAGVTVKDALQKALEDAVKALPIPKVMNYQLADGVTTVQFVRPVKHLVALYGEDIVDVEMFGLKAGRTTMGHRFESAGEIEIASADAYEETMRETGHVMADYAKRRLAVPEECLILTMQTNQKYFPMRDAQGKLMNRFCLVSHIHATDGGKEIVAGNARVVRARLADAEFFYTQDCQTTLESRVPGLSHVVYHNKLGSQGERMLRVKAIARAVAEKIGADAVKAERAAELAKADLRTLMVGEFPELQGIMGEYYARHDGEAEEVAQAISQHYLPRFAGDKLPDGPVATALAIADKLETLAGMFGIGQMPTGDKDPFALRRHALGVLRMLIEKNLTVKLDELVAIAFAVETKVEGVTDASEALTHFFFDRLRVMMREAGYSAQEVDAVLAKHDTDLAQTPKKLAAVHKFMQLPESASLAAANKRIANILKKSADVQTGEVDDALLVEEAEKKLYDVLGDHEPIAKLFFEKGEYEGMLATLTPLKDPVDAFFADVMVNSEDEKLRLNRLALLKRLYALMNRVAELSRLAI